MEGLNTSNIEKNCKELFLAFEGILSWAWEERFETAMAVCSVKEQDKVLAILKQYLNTTWDVSNINTAPDAVQAVSNNLGGTRAGQILFTSELNSECFIFCAWWPWGNGETISLRVAPVCSKTEKDELIKLFKEWVAV